MGRLSKLGVLDETEDYIRVTVANQSHNYCIACGERVGSCKTIYHAQVGSMSFCLCNVHMKKLLTSAQEAMLYNVEYKELK